MRQLKTRHLTTLTCALAGAALFSGACQSDGAGIIDGPDAGGNGGGGGDGGQTQRPDAGGESIVDPTVPYHPGEERACGVEIHYAPSGSVARVEVAGEWDDWQRHRIEVGDDGVYTTTIDIEAGLYAYKLVVDDDWILDPNNSYRAYHGGVENSALRVPDCTQPHLELENFESTTSASGTGSAVARVQFFHGNGAASFDAESARVIHEQNFERTYLDRSAARVAGSVIEVDLEGLREGKHTLIIEAADEDGRGTERLLLPFWVEREAFDWNDPILYMVMIDRFRDGDPSNTPDPLPGATSSADWYGGDLRGVADAIEEGYLDELGVQAIWLSPFVDNSRNVMFDDERGETVGVTAYHGYWPRSSREIDPRFGTPEDLERLVAAAHDRGIRVLKDFVINHIHDEHHYMTEHPEWFQGPEQSCVCGTGGCDWTEKRLECLFRPYMPNVDWRNRDAGEQMIADALWWIERYNLDGLRVDAVKHVEDLAIFNLSTRIRERFEQAGNHYYLVGETAMGFNEGDNSENYDTISRYIGPSGLDGQKDFVLYHGVSLSVFAHEGRDLAHADFWVQENLRNYPEGAIMKTYIGSHDSIRFATEASQDPNAGNCWPHQQLPGPPSELAYERMRVAKAWLFTIPGIPLLYYGDEYGQYGGCDPDNRHMWRPPSERTANENALHDFIKTVGQARIQSPALRRGDYRTLYLDQSGFEVLAYGRQYHDDAAVVVLNRSANEVSPTISLGDMDSVPEAFVDAIHGGAPVPTSGGTISVHVPARSAAILLPAD
jgi:neopullulanase